MADYKDMSFLGKMKSYKNKSSHSTDDLIKFMSFGKIDPDRDEREREIQMASIEKKMAPKEAPNPNDPQARMNRERALAQRRTTGRASTEIRGSNKLG